MAKRDRDSPTERSRRAKAKALERWKAKHPSIERGWRYMAYPSTGQALLLASQGHVARACWNYCHEWWGKNRTDERLPAKGELDEALKVWREDEDWRKALPAQACQAVAAHYYEAWKACWARRSRAPELHARARTKLSVAVPQARDLKLARVSRKFAQVNVPLVGVLRFRYHRPIPANARAAGANLSCEAGRWYLVLKVSLPEPEPRTPVGARPVVGYDAGVVLTLAGSDGSSFAHGPWYTEGELRRLYLLGRQAARRREARWARSGGKGKGWVGSNERKAYDEMAKVHATAKRRREDWQHKVAWEISSTTRCAVFEDLRLAQMTKSARGTVGEPGKNVAQKAGLNRALLGEALARLVSKVSYKSEDNGGATPKVPAPYTSMTCHCCGSCAPGQRESQAWFRCRDFACGWAGNADYNAACNILLEALRRGLVPPPFGGTPNAARSRYELEAWPSVATPVVVAEALSLEGPWMRENVSTQRPLAA